MKTLFIADIVGESGRRAVNKLLKPGEYDFVIANCENAAGGLGITGKTADEIFSCGVDVITLGNHAFDRKEFSEIIDHHGLLRPANYPEGCPGKGFAVYPARNRKKIGVVNLLGRVYMPMTDNPFLKADSIIRQISVETNTIIVDFHAEITSEKIAMAYYLDGRISALIGTHTHVQTADERIFSGGTAYITDAGMTGPADSVIGMDKDVVIKKYLTSMPAKYALAAGAAIFQGVELHINDSTGKAESIKRINLSDI